MAVLCLGIDPLEAWFERLSFDMVAVFAPETHPENIVYVQLDEKAYRELKQKAPAWDRNLYSRLLDRLTADHAKLAVFDIFLADPGTSDGDRALAEAMARNGHVVLGASYQDFPGLIGGEPIYPREEFKVAAAGLGSVGLLADSADGVVRRMHPGYDRLPSLAWRAAELAGAKLPDAGARLATRRWLNYPSSLDQSPRRISFSDAMLNQQPGFFTNKVVFVGTGPRVRLAGEPNDYFKTPFRRFGGGPQPGGIIHLVTFLNLMHGNWFEELPGWATGLLIIGFGLLIGFVFSMVRAWLSVVSAAGIVAIVFAGASTAMLSGHRWFPWIILAGVQVPFALGWANFARFRRLARAPSPLAGHERAAGAEAGPALLQDPESVATVRVPVAGAASRLEPEKSPVGAHGSAGTVQPAAATTPAGSATELGPSAPDHRLIRCIGEGAYGKVWLAQDIIGTFHAVKFLFRKSFAAAGPYDREFHGIQQFTPISRMHPGFVNILHVGRNEEAGYFFYIMELGDDERSGQVIDPATYRPKTLGQVIRQRGRLPGAACLGLGLELSSALDFLHQQGLIHRDIKPGNIIYLRDQPKLADVGLVTRIDTQGGQSTYIGTEGYIPPEGPGTPAADIYSLGKVLYETAMGLDRLKFPELPTSLIAKPEPLILRLNEIVLKACEFNPRQRYQSARELHDDLAALTPK